ncbi:MAG TPA: hypothetical protein VHP33_12385 [Polyangiaceae bacterium]|nr:hypothetical protein [Polyangiaceae bacterium]
MKSRPLSPFLMLLASSLPACADANDAAAQKVTYRDDVTLVTDADDALPHVFIPPFIDCREPLDGVPGNGPDGEVCANVAISGCTEEGRYYPDYASCDVVLTQRPYAPLPPLTQPTPADDPRLDDADYMGELAWAKQQVEASACTCCHDSRQVPSSQWDVAAEPIWLDTLSNSGLALFSGLADSSTLGAFPAGDNFGFDRSYTGIPSTDGERMRAFMLREMERRGVSVEEAKAVPPFGGPIYANYNANPTRCTAEQGIDSDGVVRFPDDARYVYVLEAGTKNPGVPPNLDVPEGTLWRLDVLPNAEPIRAGFHYGDTPPGSYQHTPAATPAPRLYFATTYHFVVIKYVGLTSVNCTFELGAR